MVKVSRRGKKKKNLLWKHVRLRRHSNAVVNIVFLAQKGSGLDPWIDFGLSFVRSLHVACVGFLWELEFPPTVLKLAD